MEHVSLSVFLSASLMDRITQARQGSYHSTFFCQHWDAFYEFAKQQNAMPERLPAEGRVPLGIRVPATVHDEICQLTDKFATNKSVIMRNCFLFACQRVESEQVTEDQPVTATVIRDPLLPVIGAYLLQQDRDKFAEDVIQIVTADDREALARSQQSRQADEELPVAQVPTRKELVKFIDTQGSVSIEDIRQHFWTGQTQNRGLPGGLISRLRRLVDKAVLDMTIVDEVELYSVVHQPRTDEDSILAVIGKDDWVSAEYLSRHLYLDRATDDEKQLALGRVHALTDKGLIKVRLKSDKLQWALNGKQEV